MFDQLMAWLRLRPHGVIYPEVVTGSTFGEQEVLVALLRERPRGLTWMDLTGAVIQHGSAANARAEIVPEELFGDATRAELLRTARRDIDEWRAEGLQFLTITEPGYPARVRDIHEAPPFVFARGQLRDRDDAVSVVGSRKATSRGLQMAEAIAEALVSMDLTVLSGLAAGIDSVAHRTALRLGGRTVAVLGTGIRRYYPAANRALQDRIAESGLVLSQFWPDAPPQQHNFPMRNAVMSGYGLATIVVEAGETSGARIQARVATEHGRPVILTDLVVTRNEWARQLMKRPDVHVASSLDEVIAVVRSLVERPARLGAVLDQLSV